MPDFSQASQCRHPKATEHIIHLEHCIKLKAAYSVPLHQHPYLGKIKPRDNHYQYLAILPPEILKSTQKSHTHTHTHTHIDILYLQNQSLATYAFDYLYFQNIKTVQQSHITP